MSRGPDPQTSTQKGRMGNVLPITIPVPRPASLSHTVNDQDSRFTGSKNTDSHKELPQWRLSDSLKLTTRLPHPLQSAPPFPSEGKKSRWVGQALSSVTQSQFSDSHCFHCDSPQAANGWEPKLMKTQSHRRRRASGPSPWTRHLPDAGPRASPGSAEAQIQAQILRRGCDILPGQGWHIYSKRPVGGNFRPPWHAQKFFSNEVYWHF